MQEKLSLYGRGSAKTISVVLLRLVVDGIHGNYWPALHIEVLMAVGHSASMIEMLLSQGKSLVRPNIYICCTAVDCLLSRAIVDSDFVCRLSNRSALTLESTPEPAVDEEASLQPAWPPYKVKLALPNLLHCLCSFDMLSCNRM